MRFSTGGLFMIFKLWRFLTRLTLVERLPHLPQTIANPLDFEALDDDILLILMTGRARDISSIQRLMERFKASSARELIPHLLKRKKANLRRRWRAWLQRLEGSTEHEMIIRPYIQTQKKRKG